MDEAQAEADRQANDARVAQIEAQQQAEQQRQQAERDKQDANYNTYSTVYWGWGAGPRTWHNPAQQPTQWPENPATRGRQGTPGGLRTTQLSWGPRRPPQGW